MSKNTWTEDQIATLRRMWGEDRSASDIAKALGGLTRNAVVGKSHRLGLVREQEPGARSKVARPEVAKASAAVPVYRTGPVDRPNVRVAIVPVSGTVMSGSHHGIRVSLPREPWLAGGVA